jgi:hypothetical protein
VAATAHSLALLSGSLLTAVVLVAMAGLAGPLPLPAVAAVCLASAVLLVLQAVVPLRLPGSRWMVPREWARFGTPSYAALFGFALGTGVITALPSPALYALLAMVEAAPRWWQAVGLMLVFGLARGAMVPLLTARSARRGVHPSLGIDRLRATMARLGVVEIVLLVALGVEILVG